MHYVNLGRSGLRVSRICFGAMSFGTQRAWTLSEDKAKPLVKKAIEAGVNFFDTANAYSSGESEEILGRALKDYAAHREDVVIATKVFFSAAGFADRKENRWGLSRKHILHEVDQSLRRLGTDYIDLYQIHRLDPRTPIEETLEALDACVRAGKVRYIGSSSMWAWQFERALATSERLGLAKFVSMQNHYNLVYREEEREMLPLCRERGIGVIPWSPLARGFLAGNRTRQGPATTRAKSDEFFQVPPADLENDFEVFARVQELAERHKKPAAVIALSWLLAQPAITAPIVGATKVEQLEQLLTAVDFALSEDEIKYLGELYRPHQVRGHA
jgi:aryl-alcohol dehydrogenase (NADP+)